MQGLNAAEKRQALAAFVDIDVPAPLTKDRSDLERWATCPAQAAYVAAGRVNNSSLAAAAGEEVHQAFGRVLADYVCQFQETGTYPTPRDMRLQLEQEILAARPDVQPQAIAGMKASMWAWADYVARLHANNIIGFDGGEAYGKSGQLAWDIAGTRITSELDLLHETESPDVLREVDYKSGWKFWGVGDVADSFQFQFHAVLALHNFEAVDVLEVCVWNSRVNRLSPRVPFYRDKLPQYTARVSSAIGAWHQHSGKAPELTETWPAVEKCSICAAAALCPAAGHVAEVAADPAAFVLTLSAVEAKADAMRKLAAGYVDSTGKDIVTESGLRFGRNKPASEKKKPATLYQLGGTNEVQESNGNP